MEAKVFEIKTLTTSGVEFEVKENDAKSCFIFMNEGQSDVTVTFEKGNTVHGMESKVTVPKSSNIAVPVNSGYHVNTNTGKIKIKGTIKAALVVKP